MSTDRQVAPKEALCLSGIPDNYAWCVQSRIEAVGRHRRILAGQAKYLMDVGGDTKNAEQVMLNVFEADGWKNAPVQPEIRAHLLLTLTLAGGKWYINM